MEVHLRLPIMSWNSFSPQVFNIYHHNSCPQPEMSPSDAFANLPGLFRQLGTIPAGDDRRSLVLQSFATTEAARAAPVKNSTAGYAIAVDAIARDATTEVTTPGIATARHALVKEEVSQKPLTDQYVLILVDTHTHPVRRQHLVYSTEHINSC
jgi:hypothetical protein